MKVDLTKASELYELAAAQGHAEAQHSLGFMHHHGLGVRKNFKLADEYYRMAAEQGHFKAQANLGVLHYFGEGGREPDYAKARRWWESAANSGQPNAQYNMGLLYLNGHGVEQSDSMAMQWYTKAAEQGMELAPQAIANVRSTTKNLQLVHCVHFGAPIALLCQKRCAHGNISCFLTRISALGDS